MAHNSKKAVAIVLTAMMAATALTGCGGSGSQQSQAPAASGTQSQTPATSGTESQASSGENSTAAQSVDILGEEMTTKIKDKIASEAEKTDNVVKLKVWCASNDGNLEKHLAQKFVEKYSDSRYELKVTVLPGIGEDNAGDQILQDPTKGADVFSLADNNLRELVEQKAVAEVGTAFAGNVANDNTDASIEACKIDGKLYAFPKTSDNGFFLYYDKRVYKDEKDIATFDSLVDIAAQQNKNVLMAIDNAWYNTGFFFTAGCEIKLENGVQSADFDSDKGLSAVKAMCHLAEKTNKGFKGTGDDSVVIQGFKSGTIAAAVTGTWNGAAIRDAIGEENVGAAKLPTVLMDGEQKQLESFGGYKIMAVRSSTSYPLTAQVLAYYLTSEDSQTIRNLGSEDGKVVGRGLLPTNKKSLESDEIKNNPAILAVDAQREFSHPQSCVGGKYWTPVGSIGSDINAANGKLSDDQIKQKLSEVVASFQ
ncbi:MAG: extracellular solute-binding protein [Clostridia bacterium]|nr:extracellular solute-binding protein [Clostridia bacterium]